jgi:Protein of unknown function (DUF3997)
MQSMYRRPHIALVIFMSMLVCSCQDTVLDLSGGFFYRNEGGDVKDILYHEPGHGEVPATVVGIAFDKNFILAKQLPKVPSDPLYERNYVYQNGPDVAYYWIVDLQQDSIWGPMAEVEFKKTRLLVGVPAALEIPAR